MPSFATQALATGVLDGLLSQNSLRAGFWTCSRKLPPVCPTRLRYLTLLLVSGATDEPSQQVLSLALQHEERNSRSKKSQRLHFLRWVLLPLPVTLPGRKVCFADASCLPSGPAAAKSATSRFFYRRAQRSPAVVSGEADRVAVSQIDHRIERPQPDHSLWGC